MTIAHRARQLVTSLTVIDGGDVAVRRNMAAHEPSSAIRVRSCEWTFSSARAASCSRRPAARTAARSAATFSAAARSAAAAASAAARAATAASISSVFSAHACCIVLPGLSSGMRWRFEPGRALARPVIWRGVPLASASCFISRCASLISAPKRPSSFLLFSWHTALTNSTYSIVPLPSSSIASATQRSFCLGSFMPSRRIAASNSS